MLSVVTEQPNGKSSGVARREVLRVGGLSLLGLSATRLRELRANDAERPRAKSCVFIFLFGGPSHIDLWDMKPAASAEIRGEFRPIATNVAGIEICEHLPLLAQQVNRLCFVRSMTHRMPVHGPACSEMYTGREYFGPPTTDQELPQDWPSLASLVMRFGSSPGKLPPSIVLPWYSQFVGQDRRIAGQTGGRMGQRFNPVLIDGDPSRPDFNVPGLQLFEGVDARRLEWRRELLRRLQTTDAAVRSTFGPAARLIAENSDLAFTMLEQPAFRRALDLRDVPRDQRDRYGSTKFGQSLLLARRLVEAEVPLVTVNWYDDSAHDKVSPHWDTHHNIFPKLKDGLCPNFDRGLAAFLADLDEHGLLDSTLVAATGEFGRTPRIGQFSQNAMTEKTGRDHWPHAFTVLLAGGGVRGGQVYGSTSRDAAYVVDQPVTPADLAATILQHLGIDATKHYFDGFQNVDQHASEGKPIRGLG